MEIQWEHSGKKHREAVSVAERPYVKALGFETAAKVFLELGGSSTYVKKGNAASDGQLMAIIGPERIEHLREELGGYGEYRVPLARKFLSVYYRSLGMGVAEIARKTRVSETTVRAHCANSSRSRGTRTGAA